jgi:hypothetical protein
MRNRISDPVRARLSKRAGLVGAAVVAALAVAAPALAVPSNKSECRRITRQIDHFEDVAMMAADRGDRLWYTSTTNHIDRLAARRVWLCPEYAEPNYAKIYAEWVAAVVKKAGQAFLQYLTFGAYSPGI